MVISCFGITFKANVSDLRESPSLSIIKKLLKLPFKKINIVEPNINKIPQFIYNDNVELCSISKSIEKSDILLFFVEHHEFTNINREKLKGKIVLDHLDINHEVNLKIKYHESSCFVILFSTGFMCRFI